MSRYVHDESRSVHQPSMAGASFEFLVEITFPLLDLRGLKATQDLSERVFSIGFNYGGYKIANVL